MPNVPLSVENDPFLDTDFAPLDLRTHAQHVAELGKIAEDNPELQEGLVQEDAGIPTPPTVTSPDPTQDDQPEVFDVDGGTVTLTHDAKGWHGTLELEDGGNPEVFHGKTQKELITKVLAGKLNATKQIRKLNKKLKLGTPVEEIVQHVEQPINSVKALNANDIFEIKTALEADPDRAFDLRFQKKYGMSEADFVALVQKLQVSARKGEEAYEELTIEGVSKEFLENHKDDYYPYAENGQALMAWLCKNKLRRPFTTADNFGTVSSELLKKSLYTVENLEEAFEDLRDNELLIEYKKPVQQVQEEEELEPLPTPVPRQIVREVPPAQASERIVNTRRQPRGGLGIRANSISSPTPEEPRAPSADELENMSTEQLGELLKGVYKHARNARR